MAEVEFKGLDKIIVKLDKMQDTSTIVSAMQDACDLVEGSAKDKAPKDTGALRRSITSKVEVNGSEIDGIVFTPVEYAAFCEFGTGLFAENGNGRKTPWVYKDDKGNYHYTHGQHPQPFMRPALKENEQNIKKKLKEGIMSD